MCEGQFQGSEPARRVAVVGVTKLRCVLIVTSMAQLASTAQGERFAREQGNLVMSNPTHPGSIVLGADTRVKIRYGSRDNSREGMGR